MSFPWMRELRVVFSNKVRSFEISDAALSITVNKFLSPLKDEAIIKIKNFPYSALLTIIKEKIYKVAIWAGYKTTGSYKIFEGGVSFVSNQFDDTKTNTTIFLCNSTLVAELSQKRIDLSFNSGVNMYALLKECCKVSGITSSNISEQYRQIIKQEPTSISSTFVQYLSTLGDENQEFVAMADTIIGPDVTIYDGIENSKRKFDVSSMYFDFSMGFPKLDQSGLELTIIPVYQFMCGDIIKIDNSLIDVSSTTLSDSLSNKSFYLDENGLYAIFEMSYNLENRTDTFRLDLTCKSNAYLQALTLM